MQPYVSKLLRPRLTYCLILAVLAYSPLRVEAIEVTGADMLFEKDTIYLNADATIELPENVQAALDKGVDLFFSSNIKIVKDRKFLPDKPSINVEVIRRLGFHALTKKYVVDDLTLGERKSFTSVSNALVYLGRYRKMPLANSTIIKTGPDTHVRMRIKLIHQKLPLPLRLKRFFSSTWRLSSNWYTWPLK